MAKIILNNKEFNINDAVLASITNELKNHLLTIMAGSGATIILDGISYNIDSTKLLTATNNLVSHLGTIAGSGEKVIINGVEYAVDSVKIADITSDLDDALGVLERLELLTSPTIEIAGSILSIYDEEGLATEYDILVDGVVKDTVEKGV